MRLYVGTSGWAYKEWKPAFYPENLPRTKFLEHYSKLLTACEINATFYRLQSSETFVKWAAATPESFRYSIKAHRGLTHGKRIGPDEGGRAFLDRFLGTLAPLGPRLGVVLFQFPPYRHRDDEGLHALLNALAPENRYAFEFRHDSWEVDEVRDLIARAGATVCVSNTNGKVPESLPPGPHAYVRLRTDRYDESARSGWLELLQQEAKHHDVFAFAKHEGIPADDPYGGVGLARWLADAG